MTFFDLFRGGPFLGIFFTFLVNILGGGTFFFKKAKRWGYREIAFLVFFRGVFFLVFFFTFLENIFGGGTFFFEKTKRWGFRKIAVPVFLGGGLFSRICFATPARTCYLVLVKLNILQRTYLGEYRGKRYSKTPVMTSGDSRLGKHKKKKQKRNETNI